MKLDNIIILDYGSQYTQLIARRIRELKVYSEIYSYNTSIDKIIEKSPSGIILSGGPMSVYDNDSYKLNSKLLSLDVPILGICYGMQLLMKELNSQVIPSKIREYGHAKIKIIDNKGLFDGIESPTNVWMSHGDKIRICEDNFKILAHSDNGILAAACHKHKPYFGVQFHPEVIHTDHGKVILSNFLFKIANCKPTWNSQNFIKESVIKIREKVGGDNIICGISGGVDSTVMGALIHKAIGQRAKFIFVNHGLLRKNEESQVMSSLKKGLNMDIQCIQASDLFLDALKDINDPEKKRKIIGKLFIDTFEKASKSFKDIKYLSFLELFLQ